MQQKIDVQPENIKDHFATSFNRFDHFPYMVLSLLYSTAKQKIVYRFSLKCGWDLIDVYLYCQARTGGKCFVVIVVSLSK